MKESMTCDRFADELADFLERDVSESTRATMEAHALSCDDCGPLLADLRRLRLDAANLAELAPSRDLWAGISARIETPIVELPAHNQPSEVRRPRRASRHLALGLAAAGLVAVTATITHEMTKRSIAPDAASTTTVAAAGSTPAATDSAPRAPLSSPPAPATTVAAAPANSPSIAEPARATTRAAGTPARLASNGKPSAEQTYDREIAKLRTVLNYRRNDLDSATVAVVDKNLKIIDDAIAQCRLALKKDPASRYLLESLNDALDSKVQLLRTAATLPARS